MYIQQLNVEDVFDLFNKFIRIISCWGDGQLPPEKYPHEKKTLSHSNPEVWGRFLSRKTQGKVYYYVF